MNAPRPKLPRLRRRKLTRLQKAGVGSAVTFVGLLAIGVVAGILIDRLLDFGDTLDTGGEWDEGGGVHTRWY